MADLVGKIGKLINANYQDVGKVTLPGNEPWPESIIWAGRVFTLYSVTSRVNTVPDMELYREVTCFKVPT